MATQLITKGTETLATPNAGDSIYVKPGSQGITGNVDYSGVNLLVLLEISQGFNGSIGTSSSPFKAGFSSLLRHGGQGEVWWVSDSADADTTALVTVDGGGMLHYVSGGPAARLEVVRGMLDAGNGAGITTARFESGGSFLIDDTGSGGAITRLDMLGGNGTSRRPHTTINGGAGMLRLEPDTTGAVNAQGTVNLWGQSMRIVVVDSGTITALNWLDGVFDITQLSGTLTITDCTINMTLPGAQALLDHPRISFSNTPVRIMGDGRPA